MAKVEGLSFHKKPKKKISASMIREIASWVSGIIIAIFIAAVFNYFWGMSTNVVGVSMEPTLYNGQQVLIDRFMYMVSSPKAKDVVVFRPHGNKNTHYYVKRVVAVPGDKVLIQNGKLYINGEECDFFEASITDGGIAENELTLGENQYFCIGDSPGSSEDSRSANIGPINKEDIIGKAWFVLPYEEGKLGFIR